jgi:hypothetical protein
MQVGIKTTYHYAPIDKQLYFTIPTGDKKIR